MSFSSHNPSPSHDHERGIDGAGSHAVHLSVLNGSHSSTDDMSSLKAHQYHHHSNSSSPHMPHKVNGMAVHTYHAPADPHLHGHPIKKKHTHHIREPGARKDFHQKLFKTPKEVVEAIIGAAEHKVSLTFDKTVLLGIMAGIYVGFGGMFALSVSQNLPNTDPGFQRLILGMLFAYALAMIIFIGGELFTGNTMYLTIGMLSGKVKPKQALLNLVTVYFSNWLGCCIVAYFFAYLTDMYKLEPYHTNILNLSAHKLEMSAGVTFLRSIPANWMVCVGIFFNQTAEDVSGKIIGMVFAVACFASIGFEHCIANMFYVDLALMYGLSHTFGDFLTKNLILVTIGNIIGGGFFVGAINWYIYCTGVDDSAPTKMDQKRKMKEHASTKLFRFTWDKKFN